MHIRYWIRTGLFLIPLLSGGQGRVESAYGEYPVYNGQDLGLRYKPDESVFRIWSPEATAVALHLYESGDGNDRIETISMMRGQQGSWSASVNRDLKGLYYTYQVTTRGGTLDETPGIYARAVGVNGRRAAIVDFRETQPPGWEKDKAPVMKHRGSVVIYELQIRDFTIHPSSGNKYPGKYLGLTQRGTRSPSGKATGLDHLVELGVTDIHLMPAFDFRSIDESKTDRAEYNWGYDPKNYNVPDGSFSTNPFDPLARIREFKKMVMALHEAGLRVILDVVYNHTGDTEKSNFNLEVPGYYYRHTPEGGWSDAAACGNETASERAMMRKFMIESCLWWVNEYHIDGFRFDLMGIHDIGTMNAISKELLFTGIQSVVYGEGWTAGKSPLPDSMRALKANVSKLINIAAFSDELRDGLKGSVFDEKAKGFVNGGKGDDHSIRFGIVAATDHPQVDYSKVNYAKAPWARQPNQCITYVSCHDNHTLADKLRISGEGKYSTAELEAMDKLANGIVLTSQGTAFLHAGEEMMRTKRGVENSFNKPDSINAIDWNWKDAYPDVLAHYKALIGMRRAHPAFALPSTKAIRENLRFLETPTGVVSYTINGSVVKDPWANILVIANGNAQAVTLSLPANTWTLRYDGSVPGAIPTAATFTGRIVVKPRTLIVLSTSQPARSKT